MGGFVSLDNLFCWLCFMMYFGRYYILVFVPFVLQLDPPIKEAFDVAYDNIYAFHAAQKSPEKSVENMKVCQC